MGRPFFRRLMQARYRGALGGSAATAIVVSVGVIAACAVIAAAVVVFSHVTTPNYAQEAAQRVAQNVQTQVQASVMYDASMAAQIQSRGPQTWQVTVPVRGQATQATIATAPLGNVLTIDVTIGSTVFRSFVPITPSAITPGSTVRGG